MRNWYAVQCKPNQDARAESNLANQAFEIFRPRARVRRRYRGQVKHAIESLFPRYLFVHLDDLFGDWGPIRYTRGVAGLVRFRNRPAVVPETIIDDLRGKIDTENCIDLSQPRYKFRQRVRIVDGPFNGYEALFSSMRGEDRVIVLLDVMQQTQRLVMPELNIEPA